MMLKGKIKQIINDMRTEADDLRGDTLTSMAEGVCNERMADELEKWATKLEASLDTGLTKTEEPKLT